MTAAGVRQPLLMIVAGPNGSGKTSLTTKVLSSGWAEGVEYINPDLIAQNEFGSWNDVSAVMQAAQLAQERREAHLRSGSDFAFETVLSTAEKVAFLRRARSAGYFVRLFFICTDTPTINAARIAARVMEGGHDVPIAKIISRYAKAVAQGAQAAALANRTYLYDNSVDGHAPTLLLRAADGVVIKRYIGGHAWADAFESAMTAAGAGNA